MKFSIPFIVPLVYHWNQCSVRTGAVAHAATGRGALRGIYEHNPIISLYEILQNTLHWVKFSIPPIFPLVYHWNQCSVRTGAVANAATGGGALGGIYKNNPLISLYRNNLKYIAISEILNSSCCPTCIPLKSMFRPGRRRWTCCRWWRSTRRHQQK